MKLTDYTDLINKMVATPEEAPALANDLLKNINDDLTVIENLNNKVEEQKSKITDLQNTNIKLFLSQTGSEPGSNNSDDDTSDDGDKRVSLDDLVKNMKGAFDELK